MRIIMVGKPQMQCAPKQETAKNKQIRTISVQKRLINTKSQTNSTRKKDLTIQIFIKFNLKNYTYPNQIKSFNLLIFINTLSDWASTSQSMISPGCPVLRFGPIFSDKFMSAFGVYFIIAQILNLFGFAVLPVCETGLQWQRSDCHQARPKANRVHVVLVSFAGPGHNAFAAALTPLIADSAIVLN